MAIEQHLTAEGRAAQIERRFAGTLLGFSVSHGGGLQRVSAHGAAGVVAHRPGGEWSFQGEGPWYPSPRRNPDG